MPAHLSSRPAADRHLPHSRHRSLPPSNRLENKIRSRRTSHHLAVRLLNPPSNQRNRRNPQQVSCRPCSRRNDHLRLAGRSVGPTNKEITFLQHVFTLL